MNGSQILIVEGRGKITFVEADSITYVEANGHEVLIHCPGEKYPAKGPFREVERKLAGHDFVRIHRSYLVSLSHIRVIEDGWIVLDDLKETELPVGLSYEQNLRREIGNRNYLRL